MDEIVLKVLSIERIESTYEYELYSFNYIFKDKKILYNNDGSFNSVKVNENIFVNISNKDLNKEVSKKLKEFSGKFFILVENNYKVYIDNIFAKEYVYSKYTGSLNRQLKLTKFLLINYIEEIINYSTDKIWESNVKEKHKRDAKYGFYKYNIKFTLSINDKHTNYNAVVLIRNDLNKRKYLYDILNIKKID